MLGAFVASNCIRAEILRCTISGGGIGITGGEPFQHELHFVLPDDFAANRRTLALPGDDPSSLNFIGDTNGVQIGQADWNASLGEGNTKVTSKFGAWDFVITKHGNRQNSSWYGFFVPHISLVAVKIDSWVEGIPISMWDLRWGNKTLTGHCE